MMDLLLKVTKDYIYSWTVFQGRLLNEEKGHLDYDVVAIMKLN